MVVGYGRILGKVQTIFSVVLYAAGEGNRIRF